MTTPNDDDSKYSLLHKAWSFIPLPIRNQAKVRALAHKIKRRMYSQSDGVIPASDPSLLVSNARVIETIEELDEMLMELDKLAQISDDELRKGFTTFQMRFPMALPKDPDSEAYRDCQFKLYQHLAGKDYQPQNEVSNFDVEAAIASPFPFFTRSPYTVGHHLISIGHLIRTLNLPKGARILEFGPGWGNTTLWLTQMGYQVTAVDIEPNFVELVKQRGKGNGVSIDIRQGDFSLIKTFGQEFDAVLFFECFHHSSNHQELVAHLNQVVRPGGKVFFAAEPIVESFPIPWGLRLDGESLWAIRNFGWLELGFKESYFRELLKKNGWRVEKFDMANTPWCCIFVASRLDDI